MYQGNVTPGTPKATYSDHRKLATAQGEDEEQREEVGWRFSMCALQESTGPTSNPARRVAFSF